MGPNHVESMLGVVRLGKFTLILYRIGKFIYTYQLDEHIRRVVCYLDEDSKLYRPLQNTFLST